MKKINFSKRYGLESAVIERRKWKTRRMARWDMLCDMREDSIDFAVSTKVLLDGRQVFTAYNAAGDPIGQAVSAYHIGEEVAVAQSYESIVRGDPNNDFGNYFVKQFRFTPGWTNKLFVRADLMPHRIRITDIRMERLQDISDEDCLREGIMEGEFMNTWDRFYFDSWGDVPNHITFRTPRAAFAVLIDRISGRGTWEKNPWVWVYSFELIN